jgi:predicted DNA-binding transcriptional regulator AlpA
MPNSHNRLLSTKQLPEITGLSKSFFEKGRIYGYGPQFIRIKSGRRAGKILYRPEDVERWLSERECDPEAARDV